MSRLAAITHAAGRATEAKLLITDWAEDGDSVAADIEAAHGALTAAVRLLTSAMVRESRPREGGEANT